MKTFTLVFYRGDLSRILCDFWKIVPKIIITSLAVIIGFDRIHDKIFLIIRQRNIFERKNHFIQNVLFESRMEQ